MKRRKTPWTIRLTPEAQEFLRRLTIATSWSASRITNTALVIAYNCYRGRIEHSDESISRASSLITAIKEAADVTQIQQEAQCKIKALRNGKRQTPEGAPLTLPWLASEPAPSTATKHGRGPSASAAPSAPGWLGSPANLATRIISGGVPARPATVAAAASRPQTRSSRVTSIPPERKRARSSKSPKP